MLISWILNLNFRRRNTRKLQVLWNANKRIWTSYDLSCFKVVPEPGQWNKTISCHNTAYYTSVFDLASFICDICKVWLFDLFHFLQSENKFICHKFICQPYPRPRFILLLLLDKTRIWLTEGWKSCLDHIRVLVDSNPNFMADMASISFHKTGRNIFRQR